MPCAPCHEDLNHLHDFHRACPPKHPTNPHATRSSRTGSNPAIPERAGALLSRVRDEAFRALVLARVIEPTSKLDTVRVLGEVGVTSPHRVTFMRCLKRVVQCDYRGLLEDACYEWATRPEDDAQAGELGAVGALALVLYDLTTLHFETDKEDDLRKVGMSKERRVDPQVTLGLLTTRDGFPLQVNLFEGNKAETKTLIPVLTAFRERHQSDNLAGGQIEGQTGGIVVVADAGMLSAANLLSLEENGFRFIVGSRTSKVPYELQAHVDKHGNHLSDQQTIETSLPVEGADLG